jgi:hypothetical protein
MNGIMGQLQRGEYADLSLASIYEDARGSLSLDQCMKLLVEMQREELWTNGEYQVAVDKTPSHGFRDFTIWHLSIKRLDKDAIHDWRDLQAIKNQLCGAEAEAIELYPAESRKVDSANQFHLFVFMKDNRKKRHPRVPVGWTERLVTNDPFAKGRQRRLPDGEPVNEYPKEG